MLLRILKTFIDRACTQEDAIHAKYCSVLNRLIIKEYWAKQGKNANWYDIIC